MALSALWIKTAISLPRHPKLLALADALNISRAEAVGRLVLLWVYALEFRPNGIFEDSREIARAMDWPTEDAGTLVTALTYCGGFARGFLEPPCDAFRGRVVLHDWRDFSGSVDGVKNSKRAEHAAATEEKKKEDIKREVKTPPPVYNSVDNLKDGAPARTIDEETKTWLKSLGCKNML